jgi:hypothetical protein
VTDAPSPDVETVLIEHSRCSGTREPDGIRYDCGITVPLHLASFWTHLAAALRGADRLNREHPLDGRESTR